MFILTDKRTGGVYATMNNNKTGKVIQVFEDEDDAEQIYDSSGSRRLYR